MSSSLLWIRSPHIIELTLDEIAATISDVDLILIEGYKQAEKPSIEVLQAENCRDLIGGREQRIAVVADFPLGLGAPQFGLGDVQGIANLIVQRFLN
jgi:molybdopterin-guanine dinucleotide biosynthesis protein B